MNMQILTALQPCHKTGQQCLSVLVRLDGQLTDYPQRPPIHAALILDRSSSMRGEPMRLVKEAASQFLQKLTRQDFAAVISYAGTVCVEAEHQSLADKNSLLAAIENIEPHGNTNLSGGWMRGLSLLEDNTKSGHLPLAILLTDGKANEGVTNPVSLIEFARSYAEKGIKTTTIGVGTDFDENLLKSMAQESGGRYHYVRDPEAVSAAFTDEFQEIISLVAQNVTFVWSADNQRAPSPLRLEILTELPGTVTDNNFKLHAGDLATGDVRQILFCLYGPPSAFEDQNLGVLSVDFVSLEGKIERRNFSQPLLLPAGKGGFEEQEVLAAIWQSRAHKATIQATELSQAGQFEQAKELLGDIANQGLEFINHHPSFAVEIKRLNSLAIEFQNGRIRNEQSKAIKHEAYRRRDSLNNETRSVQGAFNAEEKIAMRKWLHQFSRFLHKNDWSEGRREETASIIASLWQKVWDKAPPTEQPRAILRLGPEYLRINMTASVQWVEEFSYLPALRTSSLDAGKEVEVIILKDAMADEWAPGETFPGLLSFDGPISQIKLTGALHLYNASALKSAAIRLIAKGFFRIQLDLSDVEYIDSSGLGTLMMLQKLINKIHGGSLLILAPDGCVRKVLHTMGMEGFLNIAPPIVKSA